MAQAIKAKLLSASWTVFPNTRDSNDWNYVMNATTPSLTPPEIKNDLFPTEGKSFSIVFIRY